MATPLEIAGAHKRTEEGNNDEYYGGGGIAHASTAAACEFVPLAVRKGKTVGVWENGKVIEYMWHTDTSNAGLIKKMADVNKVTSIRQNFGSDPADDDHFPTEKSVRNLFNTDGGAVNYTAFPGGQYDITGLGAGILSHRPTSGRYNNIYHLTGTGDHTITLQLLTDYNDGVIQGAGGFLQTGAFIYVTNETNQNIIVSIPDVYWDGAKNRTMTLRPGFFLIINKYTQQVDPVDNTTVRSWFKTMQIAQSFLTTAFNSNYDF